MKDLFNNTSSLYTLEAAATSLGISNDLAQNGRQRLREAEISEVYEKDLIEPAVRRRFGQSVTGLNAHALTVAMHDGDEGMGVRGGPGFENYFRTLLDSSGAVVELETHVAGICKNSSTEWILETRKLEADAQPKYMMVNAVILAAPFDPSELQILPEPFHQMPETLNYGACHVMLFTSTSKIRPEAFHATVELPDIIFGGQQVGLQTKPFDFFELAMIRTVTRYMGEALENEYLYRILSPASIPRSDLMGLVGDSVTWSYNFEVSCP